MAEPAEEHARSFFCAREVRAGPGTLTVSPCWLLLLAAEVALAASEDPREGARPVVVERRRRLGVPVFERPLFTLRRASALVPFDKAFDVTDDADIVRWRDETRASPTGTRRAHVRPPSPSSHRGWSVLHA